MVEIKSQDDRVIYISEKLTVGEAVEEAVRRRISLPYANLRGGCFHFADFSKSDLRKSFFRGADFYGVDFREANLKDAYFGFSSAETADFSKAALARVDFHQANLIKAKFIGADLSMTYTEAANFRHANFSGAKISWSSREIISEILRQAAGRNVEKLKIAGVIPLLRDWCWSRFLAEEDPLTEWALTVLAKYVQPGDFSPIELHKYIEEEKNE